MKEQVLGRSVLRGLIAAGALGVVAHVAHGQVSQLVISEVWGGGHQNASTPNSDYVELYNRGPGTVNLNGLSVQVATAASSSWTVITLPNVTLGAREYFLIQLEPDNATGIDFASDMTLNITTLVSSAGKVALCNTTTALTGAPACPVPASVIDFVGYGTTANSREPCAGTTAANAPTGSITVPNILSPTRRSNGCQDTGNNSVDFVQAAPTPQKTGNFAPLVREFTATVSPTVVAAGTGAAISITGYLRDCASPTTGASVTADLSGFGLGSLALLDNGLNGDGGANDGVYGRSFNLPNSQGAGDVNITVNWVKDATNGSDSKTLKVHPAAPANDACSAAQDVSALLNGGNQFSGSVANTSAGADVDVGSCNSDTSTRYGFWYRYTPSASGSVAITETGAQDVVYGIFTVGNPGDPCNTLGTASCIATENAQFSVVAGNTYFILVGNQTATASTPVPVDAVELTMAFIPPPPNDFCNTATVLSTFPFTDTVGAAQASDDADVTCNAGGTALSGVWYTFTPNSGGTLTIAESSTTDTVRAVFDGSCGGLNQLLCSDPESVTYNLSSGTQYWIMTAAYSSTTRPTVNYEIAISFAPVTGACCSGSNCTVETQAACLAVPGRTYIGDNASCSGGPQYVNTDQLTLTDGTSGGANSVQTSTINVTDTGTVSTIDVYADLTHTFAGDLRIYLTAPNGSTSAMLIERPGRDAPCTPTGSPFGNLNDLNGLYTFTDAAPIGSHAAIVAGPSPAPTSPAWRANSCGGVDVFLNTVFNGTSMQGSWTLTVEDWASGDTGTLNSWAMAINGGASPPCTGGTTPCNLADYNDNGSVTADDIFAFLDGWFAQNGVCTSNCTADINGQNNVTADDIFAYLDLWFTYNGQTCP